MVLCLSWYTGIPLRSPAWLYVSKVAGGVCWYLVGLLLALLCSRLVHLRDARRRAQSPEAVREYFAAHIRRYFSERRWTRHLRLVHLYAALFFIFIQLKHFVPHLRHVLFDAELVAWERAVFTVTASERLIALLGTSAAPLLSAVYVSFYGYLGIAFSVMVICVPNQAAREFALATVLLWLGGILAVYLVPTWGPCFFLPESIATLPDTAVRALQEELWRQKLYTESHPGLPSGVFLISGFPSLHLAMPVLTSLYLDDLHPRCALLSWVFVAMTAIATIYFGWHYLADDLGAIVLAFGARGLAQRSRCQEQSFSEATKCDIAIPVR